jgi:HD-like signal output (HDOD) protein
VSSSRRVLIVHEEPSVQAQLRQAITAAPGGWAVEVCGNHFQALALLPGDAFDAIVAGAATATLDSRSFLDQAAAFQPRAARFVFGASGGRAVLLRAAGPAHQHLNDAAEATTAFGRLARTLALGDLLEDHDLKRLVGQLTAIPSLPSLYVAITAELSKDMVSGRRVGEMIARDPGMTAKVLQIANSPFFGFRVTIADPVHAVQLLGLETVRALVLSLHVFSQLDERVVRRFRLGKVWRHSLGATGCARAIAQTAATPPEAIDAFTAALLHDVGKLVLASSLPEKFADAIQLAEGAEIPHHEAERQTLGAPHAAVGAYLLGLWGLPETVVEAVAWHHEPTRCPATRLGVVGIVHAADAIEHQAHPADAVGRVTAVDQAYLESLGLAWQYPAWKAAWQDMSGEGQGRGLAARL